MGDAIVCRSVWVRRAFDSAGGDLEFGDLAAWIESSVSQTICAARSSPVIRNEDGIGTNSLDNHGADRDIVAARGYGNPIAVMDAVFFSEARVKFRARLRVLVDQGSNPPRLRAG